MPLRSESDYMTPYFIILFSILLWLNLEKYLLNRKAFWIPLGVLSIFAGIRSNKVGTDSGAYTSTFQSNLHPDYYEFNPDVEVGYQYFEYLLLNFTHQYYWLFLITSFLICFCYLNIIKRFSHDYIFSIFLFITLGLYTFFFNGLRQGVAMAIFALSLPYLLERRFILYFLICIFASFVHTSALFMIPFYFLVNIRIKLIYKIATVFLFSIISSRLIIQYFAESNKRYESYAEFSDESGGLFVLIFYLILLIFIYMIKKLYNINDITFQKIFEFYALGIALLIPVAMLGTAASGPQRLLSYFTWVLLLILPYVFLKINNKIIKYIFSILMIVFFYLTTSRFSNLTPYILNPVFEIF
ncbi:EpsG family protein [Acinetobacter lwoffii]|uniref:EpsG family protein n=1 Tax=Acinetobacter lwoffii TaxID=28090 RepID=UPI00208E24CE|nr:EpsG family protein [Acinetobacter lwoffii]